MATAGIFKAMCDAMNDITAIAKDRKNVQQGFKFRGIDDVYNELHDILAKHKIFTIPEVIEDRTEERQTKGGGNLIYRILKIKYHFIHEDGSEVASIVIGEGMDSGDKAANKAMSIAHKYSLFQAFLIPTEDEKDPDSQSYEVLSKNENQQRYNPQETKQQYDEQTLSNMKTEMASWFESQYASEAGNEFRKMTGGKFDNPLMLKSEKNIVLAYEKYKKLRGGDNA